MVLYNYSRNVKIIAFILEWFFVLFCFFKSGWTLDHFVEVKYQMRKQFFSWLKKNYWGILGENSVIKSLKIYWFIKPTHNLAYFVIAYKNLNKEDKLSLNSWCNRKSIGLGTSRCSFESWLCHLLSDNFGQVTWILSPNFLIYKEGRKLTFI